MSIPTPTLVRYISEFESALAPQIDSLLSTIASDPGSPSVDSSIVEVEGLIDQAEDLVRSMGIESRGCGTDVAGNVRDCKKRCGDWRTEISDARSQVDRVSLLGLGENSGPDGGDEHRARLLASSDAVDDQNERLSNARRILADTEMTALEITDELGRNREKIRSAHSRVHEVSGLTNTARQVVQSMRRREVQQKIYLYAVALLLIGSVLYFMYYLSKGRKAGAANSVEDASGGR